MKSMKSVAAGLILVLFSSACIGGRGDPTTFLVGAVTGIARLLPGGTGSDWVSIAAGTSVSPGDTVQVGEGGSLEMKRGGSTSVELRPSRRAMAELTVEEADLLAVDTGDLLVSAPEGAPLRVASGGVTARGTGVYRFDRSLSVRVGVYDGAAVVEAPSGSLELARYRQGVIAGRVLPRAPEPLRFETADPWDQRLLSDVIDLDLELQSQRRGYQAEFGATMRTHAALRPVAGGGSIAFLAGYLDDWSSGDILIGLIIALLVEERDGTVRKLTFRKSMDLLAAGATWGLIADEHELSSSDLTDAIVRAIGLRTGDVDPDTPIVGPDGVTPSPAASQGGGGSPTTPAPSPSKTSKPSPTKSPKPSPTPKPSNSPSPSPSPSDCALPILC